MKKSFYDWCIENNRQDLLDRWDYDLNDFSPKEISFATSKKIFFKCDKHEEHKSTLVRPASLTSSGQNILCRECNSFAQWIIDHHDKEYLDKIWNYEMNGISPWEVAAKSKCDIYLNCLDVEYHKGYKTTPCRFTGGQKICGFCHGLQVHPNDSFASFNIRKYGKDFLEKYWDYDKNEVNPYEITSKSGKFVFIKCQDKSYHGSYRVKANDFSSDKSKCPYCRSLQVHPLDSVAAHYPKVIELWSDKNETTPYEYSLHSAKKVWLKCNNGEHDDYSRNMRDAIDSRFYCPKCSLLRKESYLEEAVRTYLNDNYDFTVKHEFDCSIAAKNPETDRQMPYDNEVFLPFNQHLIIEVNGKQHYMITHYTNMSARSKNMSSSEILKEQQQRDFIKREYVESLNGYFYLEIPYYTYTDESYKTLIDTKIHEILSLNNTKLLLPQEGVNINV